MADGMATTGGRRFDTLCRAGSMCGKGEERIMKRIIAFVSAVCLAFGCGAAMAKGVALPKNWKTNFEVEVPKNLIKGGDACTKLTAIVRDLDVPFADPQDRKHTKISR